MDTKEQQYIDGFNTGYIIAKYEPDLLSKLIQDLRPLTNYLAGLFSGNQEYELEKTIDELLHLKNMRSKAIEREMDIDHDQNF